MTVSRRLFRDEGMRVVGIGQVGDVISYEGYDGEVLLDGGFVVEPVVSEKAIGLGRGC